jgi:di/tripeptidase
MNRLLQQLLQKTERQLLNYIPQLLVTNGYEEIISTKDYIFSKGNIPILLVAHLDTVHYEKVKDIYFDEKKQVVWSPQGIGGDDRCGVYSILKITEECKPYVLFTTKEEVGGIGATYASKELFLDIYGNVNFIIELDRRGEDDAVFYECGNESFQEYILSFGFKENYGSFSDISILSPCWDIASVNLSIGYHNEHTKSEYINLKHMNKTIKRLKNILKENNNIFYDYQEYQTYPFLNGVPFTEEELNEYF